MASSEDQSSGDHHGSSSDQQTESGSSTSRRRTEDSRMPEGERSARLERRQQLQDLRERKPEGTEATSVDPPAVVEEQETNPDEPVITGVNTADERKPWETLVIGCDLGHNLSHIERKDREIEQYRYIVRYHEEHSPDEVAHKQRVLDGLIRERSEMEDNEENNMPENQREEKNRIGERLEVLNWALDTCQCKAEEVNIRAAIQGYQSGEIPYSDNFTLIYAGHIADVCPTYRSFCVDRKERLDRYYEQFGPGWLWHEPPLSDGADNVFAKKSSCLERLIQGGSYGIGCYPVYEIFALDRKNISREDEETYDYLPQDHRPPENPKSTAHLKTLLDSGATFPVLPIADFKHLEVDLRWLSAQGVTKIITATETVIRRFFELHVSICTPEGQSLVGAGNDAVYPDSERTLGGLCPVIIDHTKSSKTHWSDRLSGMAPFEFCYISSTPTAMEIWLGEDRRDVLGARRMPSLARYDPQVDLEIDVPKYFDDLRRMAPTPEEVIFKHYFLDETRTQVTTFTDRDWPAARGKTELSTTAMRSRNLGDFSHTIPIQCMLEPRAGGVSNKYWTPDWHRDFLSPQEFQNPLYQSIDQVPRAPKRKRK
ncbi:hypothetical protein F4806DRAFT_341598 [Annulohypoxylon nitens]|nr:hypothetical protein F4806DRAFT_341598 [Annulohypoxylon nitens]